jgi:hypothetical protein
MHTDLTGIVLKGITNITDVTLQDIAYVPGIALDGKGK